jgi:hypothetical protein
VENPIFFLPSIFGISLGYFVSDTCLKHSLLLRYSLNQIVYFIALLRQDARLSGGQKIHCSSILIGRRSRKATCGGLATLGGVSGSSKKIAASMDCCVASPHNILHRRVAGSVNRITVAKQS